MILKVNRKDPTPEVVRFAVRGRVQGVGYRFFVVRAAHDLGLQGWVRNRRDGSVEVLAAGSRANLRQLEQRLWVGPPQAKVDEVTRHRETIETQFTGFAVAYEAE